MATVWPSQDRLELSYEGVGIWIAALGNQEKAEQTQRKPAFLTVMADEGLTKRALYLIAYVNIFSWLLIS